MGGHPPGVVHRVPGHQPRQGHPPRHDRGGVWRLVVPRRGRCGHCPRPPRLRRQPHVRQDVGQDRAPPVPLLHGAGQHISRVRAGLHVQPVDLRRLPGPLGVLLRHVSPHVRVHCRSRRPGAPRARLRPCARHPRAELHHRARHGRLPRQGLWRPHSLYSLRCARGPRPGVHPRGASRVQQGSRGGWRHAPPVPCGSRARAPELEPVVHL
mmetsp:Transcript_694/g.2350  ORF Transcript_694/g.2350 Transcript_694/m.2350 type:complete len:210 (+) Transcript_694:144-773(+)